MPPMFPTAAMSFELAAHGCLTGLYMINFLRKIHIYIYPNTINAWWKSCVGIVSLILYGISGTGFGWEAFIGAFVNALPGIIIQIIIIPIIIMALKRSNLIEGRE